MTDLQKHALQEAHKFLHRGVYNMSPMLKDKTQTAAELKDIYNKVNDELRECDKWICDILQDTKK